MRAQPQRNIISLLARCALEMIYMQASKWIGLPDLLFRFLYSQVNYRKCVLYVYFCFRVNSTQDSLFSVNVKVSKTYSGLCNTLYEINVSHRHLTK